MPRHHQRHADYNDADHRDDDFDAYEDDDWQAGEDGGVDDTTAGAGAWSISIIGHVLVLLILGLVVVLVEDQTDRKPVRSATIPPVEPPAETIDRPEPIEQVNVTIDAETIVDTPTVSDLDLPVVELQTEDIEISESLEAKGREEAVSTSELGGVGAFMAIGAAGGGAGSFGSRSGGARQRAVGRFGGNRASENAVERALRWFARHQSPDGKWDVDGYPVNCDDQPKCEPGTAFTDIQGDTAVTGYAVLAFLGAGYDHMTPNRFRSVVRRGLEWLVGSQQADGQLGRRNYEQGIAAMALAEAYGMTNDPWLREPAQKAINILLQRQAQDADGYPLAWDYTAPKRTRNDSSVSGWAVMALKAGISAGLDVGEGMQGAENWLERAWQASNPNHAEITPYDTSVFPYTWNADTDAIKRPGDMTCVGALVAVFLGRNQGDVMLESMGNWIMQNHLPQAWPTDTYYMYYNTLSIFQLGGDRWQTWNNTVRDLLVDNQRVGDGCFDGSWDPTGAGGHKVDKVGRLLVTAYAVLSLEVYYRYQRVVEPRRGLN